MIDNELITSSYGIASM